MKTITLPKDVQQALDAAGEIAMKGNRLWISKDSPPRFIALWVLRRMCQAITERGTLSEKDFRNLKVYLEKPEEPAPAVDSNFLHHPLPDGSDETQAHATRIEGPAYLVRMNTKATAGLEELAAQHGITPERTLALAALLILDCESGGCFGELLQEQEEKTPALKFVEASGSGRVRA